MDQPTQRCPIFAVVVEPDKRYPAYICAECSELAADRTGRPVYFYNAVETTSEYRNGQTFIGGKEIGVRGKYADTKKPYTENHFWIKGHKCIQREAHFGGVVYLLANDPWYGEQVMEIIDE